MMRDLITWNPAEDLRALEAMLSNMRTQATPATNVVPIDVTEENGALVLRASMPGVAPENIDVSVENQVLTITGEYRSETKSESAKVYVRELATGQMSRSIRLPKNVNLEQVEAQFENGIVMIRLPKMEPEKPEAIRIPVKATEPTRTLEGQASETQPV